MSTATPDTLMAVRAVRAEIDAIVTPEQRRAILLALGCFESTDRDTVPRLRRAKSPKTAGGAEMLAAIDALDIACLRGFEPEIEEAGERLAELWEMFR